MYCIRGGRYECDRCGGCDRILCSACGAEGEMTYYSGRAYCAACSQELQKSENISKKEQQMTAKEYLEQVRQMERHIEVKRAQIMHLREIATRATSVIEAVRTGGTAKRSKLADAVDEMVDIERTIERDIKRLSELYREISGVIVQIDNETYRELLTLRYLCNGKWEDIAEKMHFDPRSVYRLHGRALAEVARHIPHECA